MDEFVLRPTEEPLVHPGQVATAQSAVNLAWAYDLPPGELFMIAMRPDKTCSGEACHVALQVSPKTTREICRVALEFLADMDAASGWLVCRHTNGEFVAIWVGVHD